ncbi:MAG: hypothetical protein JO268_01755 [Pseudonocardiales bacterium]|nr:hypothetical protein [Pseudonocardiales bacterium]
MSNPSARSPLWLLEQLLRRFYLVVVVAVCLAIVVSQTALYGAVVNSWDWLLVSGFGTWLAAVYFQFLLPEKLTETLTRLVNRGVLTGNRDLAEFLAMLHHRARRSALACSAAFAAAMLVAWAVAFRHQLGSHALLVTLEIIATVPVGLFVGRAVSYGLLARRLKEEGFTLTPDPDHLDGAAGLRPVGALYFYQSRLLAVPGAFLATWWLLIPFSGGRYLNWREPYAGLLLVVVATEILAFILPMLSFRRLMLRRKNELTREADELSRLSVRAEPDETVNERRVKRYTAIESMPTWPVDGKLRRMFGLRNALLVAPALAQFLGASQATQHLIENLQKALYG